MRPSIRQLILALLAGTLATGAVAQPEPARFKARLATRLPAPLTGLYELTPPSQVVYVSADGRYLVSGRIIDSDKRSGNP